MAFARDKDAALGPGQIIWLGEPDVFEQFGDALSACERSHPARESLRAEQRRPRLATRFGLRRHEHGEIAETALPRALHQCEGRRRVRSNDCGGASREGCGDRPLVAGLDLEQRQRQPLAFLRERPRRRGQALALRERVLERRQPLAGQPRLLAQRLLLGVPHRPREERLCAQASGELPGRFAPELQPLGGALQAIQRRGRPLPAPRGARELLLDAVALLQQGLETLVNVPSGQRRSRAALLDLAQPFLDPGEVELGESRAQPRDLAAQLLRALGCARLQRKRAQPRLHLGLEVAGALNLDLHARQLQLRPVPPLLELPEPRSVLEEHAPLLGLAREHLLDLALADHRAVAPAKARVGEQLDEIGAPDGRAVDEVLALAAAMQPPRDRDLAEVERLERAVGVVEQQLDLAVIGSRPAGRAREEDVVRLLGA